MILIIDNYDSFVYNLADYIESTGLATQVVRNDQLSICDIKKLNPSHIIFSPGPCTPNEAGLTLEIIKTFKETLPMLGVCLGHQAIGQAFGGKIIRAKEPRHGKPSVIHHNQQGIFQGLNNPLTVGRYHSLVVCNTSIPSELITTAYAESGDIMAIAHRDLPIFGVQFHPESILTEQGKQLLSNFIEMVA